MTTEKVSKAEAVRRAIGTLGIDCSPADGVGWIKQHYPGVDVNAKVFSVYKSNAKKDKAKGTSDNGKVAAADEEAFAKLATANPHAAEWTVSDMAAAHRFCASHGGVDRAIELLGAYRDEFKTT